METERKPSILERATEEVFKNYRYATPVWKSADATLLLDFIKSRKSFENYKFDTYLLSIIAGAVMLMPEINVLWKDKTETEEAKIIKYDDINLGVAVRNYKNGEKRTAVAKVKDEPRKGVIKSAWHLNLHEINKVVLELSEKGMAGRLHVSKDLLPMPNIYLNNLGVYKNIDLGVPLLPKNATIMVSAFRAKETPIVFKGYIMIRPMMDVMVTFDHRLFDGEIINDFLGILIEKIENPRF